MRFSSIEPGDQEILAAAAVIRSRMRKNHRGGRRPTKRVCPWCGVECIGVKALDAHQRDCTQSPGADLCRQLNISIAPLSVD